MFRNRLCTVWARIHCPSLARTQSDELRMTIARPMYAQNARLLAKRYGVTTTGIIWATRMSPMPGQLLRV